MKKLLPTLLALLLFNAVILAQSIGINTDGSAPASSSILDIKSSVKGLLIPRMDSSDRNAIGTPANGLIVYDTDTKSFWFYNDSKWKNINAAGSLEDDDEDSKITFIESVKDKLVLTLDNSDRVVFNQNNNGILAIDIRSNNENVVIGSETSIASGMRNSILGNGAGFSMLSSNDNTLLGRNAGKLLGTSESNTMIGSGTANAQMNGNNNTYLGKETGSNKTLGDNNTLIGFEAGKNNGDNNGNIFIGHQAGLNNVGSDQLIIDNSSTTNPLLLGDFNSNELKINGKMFINAISQEGLRVNVDNSAKLVVAADGQVGIGTSTPNARLQIKSTNTENPLIIRIADTTAFIVAKNRKVGIGTDNPGARLQVNTKIDEEAFRIFNPATISTSFVVARDEQVGIGTYGPEARLHIDAMTGEHALRVRVNTITKLWVHSNGGIRNTANAPTFAFQLQNSSTDLLGRGQAFSWNVFSDRRIKSNFQNITYGLNEVMQLQPQSYDHHNSEYFEDGTMVLKGVESTPDIGLVAQDVYEIIPEAVSPPANDEELWSMDYTRLVPVLIKAIQEQQATINILSQKVELLETQLQE